MRGCSRFCRPFGRLFFVEISFDPQSLRDSPQGHTDVVKDAIGHLRPPFSMKTPFLRCAAAAAFDVHSGVFFCGDSSYPQSLRDSPRGPTDVVQDALGQLRSPGCARNNKKNTAFSGNGLVREKADFTDEMFKNADSSGKRLIFRTNLRFCLLIC